jgi:hypothetical protein
MVGETLLVAMIAAGVVIIVQGLLTLLGRRRARVTLLERPLFEVLSPKDDDQTMRTLGQLRLVYGFFLVAVGIWGLVS